METELMTLKQYADLMKVTKMAVLKAMNLRKPLPGVKAYEMVLGRWQLTVNKKLAKKNLVDGRKPSKLAVVK